MYTDPLVIDMDYTVESTRSFARRPDQGDGRTRYVNAMAAIGHPRDLTFAHQVVGKGELTRDRHMIQLSVPAFDSDPNNVLLVGKPPIVVTLTVDLWRGQKDANAGVDATMSLLCGFLRGQHAVALTPDYTQINRLVAGES